MEVGLPADSDMIKELHTEAAWRMGNWQSVDDSAVQHSTVPPFHQSVCSALKVSVS